jgi:mannose PTS system EIIA component
MIGIVVVTHGQLARELVAAAEMIIGEIPNVTAVSIGWHESPDDAEREIEAAIGRVESGKGTVVLTDMFGGTPSNLSYSFLEDGRVEVISGVNLPMVIKAVNMRQEKPLAELVEHLESFGKKSISLASGILKGNKRS